jgi:hypothetical protein
VVREDGPQTHGTRMKNSFSAKAAETGMAMDNVNLLADDDIAEYGEEGEHGRKRRFAVNDEEGNVIDLQSIGEVTDPSASFVCVGNYDDFVSPINEFLRNN